MTTHQKLYIRIWQHEVVRRNESDQVEGKSDQVGTNFDQAEGKFVSLICTDFSNVFLM